MRQHHHARKPSTGSSTNASYAQSSPPIHNHHNHRTNTDPEPPALLRLPSTSSSQSIVSPRTRRATATATSPSTPTLLTTPSQLSTSSATSPSYFSPQPAASGKEPRSPANRRPPAWNTSGIDNSRGPPITLITRGTAADIARRSQKPSRPAEFAFAQQQLLQSGLVSPSATSHSSAAAHRQRRGSAGSVDAGPPTQTNTPHLSRQNSARAPAPEEHMDGSIDGYSEYDSGMRHHARDRSAGRGTAATDTSDTDGEQGEDLFLNIASDNLKENVAESALRSERLRSRLARPSNRQSLPATAFSSSSVQSNSTTPQASRLPSAIDTRSGTQYRRASAFSITPRGQREQSPLSPANNLETPRSTRLLDPSPKPSPSARRDHELSPHQFLNQFSNSRRRPSNPEVTHTPPNRTSTYRPSNLHYSTPRENIETPHVEARHETASRVDGTESLDSTGPATSVWDELDELKTRIRRIELGGKIPATSGAVVASATERPRTANTSVTTVSSSPKQQRKTNESPTESTVGAATPHKVHPLLREALAKTRQHVQPAVYRSLEATATEAIELAELTGSAGPQGNLQTVSSVLHGALVPDRQIRRKADSICRSLTELCIELCDTKSSIASPAVRSIANAPSRRPSVQINGDSPLIRPSIEPESDTLPRSSPSRAMSRIEARRTSLMAGNFSGSPRESSHEPSTPSQSNFPNRLNRAGTSLQRTRRTGNEEDEDHTLRAPSRAMTDFRDVRSTPNHTKRFSREYTSREPMPELQPSPALPHTTSLRRPTVSGIENTSLLYRDDAPRFNIERRRTPGYEKQTSADLGSRIAQPSTQYNSHRQSMGTTGLGRSGSLNRRFRGTGE